MGAYGPSSSTPHKNVLLPVELWDADTAYTELSVVFYNNSLWVAAADNDNSAPTTINADWTQAVAGGTPGNVQGIPWDAATTYAADDIVIDRGGTWQATGASTNSQPVSGNTDWTLVAGTPYVDVLMSPVDIVAMADDEFTLVPAPGAGLLLWVEKMVLTSGPGEAWTLTDSGVGATTTTYGLAGDGATVYFSAGSDAFASGLVAPTTATATSTGPNIGAVLYGVAAVADYRNIFSTPLFTAGSALDNLPFAWFLPAGITSVGSQPLLVRTYYLILSSQPTFPTFFIITAVNQGTKTFTVTDAGADLNGATGTFDVVGSTGNNATYTIVSSISGAGSTVIIVVEAIPDATADGWVQV